MEVCVDSVESAIAFVGAPPSSDNQTTPGLTVFSPAHDTIVIKQRRTRRSRQARALLEPHERWRRHPVSRLVQSGQERGRTDRSNHGESRANALRDHEAISNLNWFMSTTHSSMGVVLLALGFSRSDGITLTADHDSSKNRFLSVLGSGDRGHEGRHPNIQRSRGRRGGLWSADDIWADQCRNYQAVSGSIYAPFYP